MSGACHSLLDGEAVLLALHSLPHSVVEVVVASTGIYSTRIRLQEGEEKIQAEEKNERLNDDNSFASEELENIFS